MSKWIAASVALVVTAAVGVVVAQPTVPPKYKPGLVTKAELPKDWRKAPSGQAARDAATRAKIKQGVDLGKALRAAVAPDVLKGVGADEASVSKDFATALAEPDPDKRRAAVLAVVATHQPKLGPLKAHVTEKFQQQLAALADQGGADASGGGIVEKDLDPPPAPQPQGVVGHATFTAPFTVITAGDGFCNAGSCSIRSTFHTAGDDHDRNGYAQAVTLAPSMAAFSVYAKFSRVKAWLVASAVLTYTNASAELVLRVADGQKELCAQRVQVARLQVLAGTFTAEVERGFQLSCTGRRDNATGGILTVFVELETWTGGLGDGWVNLSMNPAPELEIFVAP